MLDYQTFIDECMEGFKAIGIEMGDGEKQYMKDNPNLLQLEFDQSWIDATTINKESIKQTERLSKKIQNLMEHMRTQQDIYWQVMSHAYSAGKIPGDQILDMRKKAYGEIDPDESSIAWIRWSLQTMFAWLSDLKEQADYDVQVFRKQPLKGGSPKRLEIALLKAMEGYYWHFVGEKPTCDKAEPRRTKFSIVVQHVFEHLGLGVSDDALEQFIYRNLGK